MSPSIRSKPKLADFSGEDELTYCPPCFTLAGTAALYTNPNFALGFSNTDRQAAARALLRKRRGITHEEFVEAALEDVFDVLTTQDHLNGGSQIADTISPDRVAVDLYITPRELHEASEQIGGDVSVLVQAFCEEFAVPHLKRFMERCRKEDITAPHHFPVTPVNPAASPSLPAPLCPTGSRIRCSARAPAQFQRDFVVATSQESSTPSKSSAVKQATALAVGTAKMKHRQNAEVFSHAKIYGDPEVKVFGPPLISIGPNTDAVIDRFKMGDQTILKLRELITTMRSSRWEAILRSPKWDFTYEHTSNLTAALHADLDGRRMDGMHKMSAQLSVVLKIAAVLKLNIYLDTLSIKLLVNEYFRLQLKAMVNQTLSTTRRVQRLPQTRPKVHLSKKARALLTTQRRQKSRVFRAALDDAWFRINESVKTIASSHHKSIRRVQNDLYMGHAVLRYKRTKSSPWNAFCWKKHQQARDENSQESSGKAVLQDLLHNYGDEYRELSQDKKDRLIQEYDENREHKTKGVRTSSKSKINDVTQTLKAIENEVLFSLFKFSRGIIFATEGVDDFMESTMNIDNQDLVSKMEGYAIQGMRGAAKNHQDRCSKLRSAIRHIINQKLQAITGNPKATMQWADYWCNIVQRYNIICEGWPSTVPFKNLSEASSALPELKMLLDKWQSGSIEWRHLEEAEYEQLLQERLEKIESGEIIERTCRQRSDKGKKRARTSDDPSTRHRKKVYKSTAIVDSDEEHDSTPRAPSLDTSTSTSAPSQDIAETSESTSTSTLSASGTASTSTSTLSASGAALTSTSTSSASGTALTNTDNQHPLLTDTENQLPFLTDAELNQALEQFESMLASGYDPGFPNIV
ncbi:hypothetical protein EV702DRAFT_1050123 [Suillus placidus]|uniref:Uncharacterized protein n=1 Tax=Suillus placidus TaxID=48579 RepID=A0A9P6ZJW0_9AGAM|nr:hypothetical protein EV702DRAFT_1050123 [Suillus placidus]